MAIIKIITTILLISGFTGAVLTYILLGLGKKSEKEMENIIEKPQKSK
jgi:hypothetical protein